MTVGVDFMSKTIQHKGNTIRLHLWDTAGQERFQNLIPNYMRQTNCVLVCFDVTERPTFDQLERHIENMEKSLESGNNPIKCLVATKIDLDDQRQVNSEEGQAFAQKHGMSYHEVSAKTNAGVDSLFEHTIELLPIKSASEASNLKLDDNVIDKNNILDNATAESGYCRFCW